MVGVEPCELWTPTRTQFPLPVGKVRRTRYVPTKWSCVLEWLTCWTKAGTLDPEAVVIVIVVLPDLVVSAAEVAVSVTVGGVGAEEGAL